MGLVRVVLMQFILLNIVVLAVKLATVAAEADADAEANIAKPGCPSSCGNVSIPYPFGTGGDCNISANFFIKCSTDHPYPKAFLTTSNIEVLNISLDGQLRVLGRTEFDCYNESGRTNRSGGGMGFSKFAINSTRNKFTAIGCDTQGIIRGKRGRDYATGCISYCYNVSELVDDDHGSSGIGCCQTAIPKGARESIVSLDSYRNHSDIAAENPCSYAFVSEIDAYKFSTSHLHGYDFRRQKFPVTLDWTIGKISCDQAKKDTPKNYACQANNSICVDSINPSGYLCKCSDGYEGNPYLINGCQDINECKKPTLNTCEKPEYCVNTVGNYTCECPKGYHGDGRQDAYGEGCIRNPIQVVEITVGVSVCSVAVIVLCAWLYLLRKRRKFLNLKEKYFIQNGGAMLQQLNKREASSETAKLFTAEELKKATNNYDESMIVGRGGYGTVYKGILEGKNMVAIKKSKMVDQGQIEQFINEVVVLSKINHRNVVKLLGCCLEEEVPLLVYEFVTNGTLLDHIHDEGRASAMSWGIRLRIAAETAGVLSYLHSATSVPIIHRDVKTSNILLGDNYTAKVSDFGASRLVPIDQAQISTMVQGTLGYLDPEYLHTSLLTEKSDVYSFGVVLIELLTGKKVLCFDRPEGERSLAKYFVSSLRSDRLFDIVERHLVDEENRDQIMEVAKLAMACLQVKGEERPSMKQVATELEGLGLTVTEKHPWVDVGLKTEESDKLLPEGKAFDSYCSGGSSNNTSGVYNSISSHEIVLALDNGR